MSHDSCVICPLCARPPVLVQAAAAPPAARKSTKKYYAVVGRGVFSKWADAEVAGCADGKLVQGRDWEVLGTKKEVRRD